MTRPAGDTRSALLAAAADEFAAHGFAGASVDDIARRARVNKAMIYYHFADKKALYLDILRELFRGAGAATAEIAAGTLDPAAKLGAFIDAVNRMAATRPYLPPIMMRELASGAKLLDADTLRLMARLLRNLGAILDEGVRAGVFVRANPFIVYFSVISPIIFFHATAPVRAAMARERIVDLKGVDAEAWVAHIKSVALKSLAAPAPAAPRRPARPPAKPRRRPRHSRPGDHA